MALLLRALQRAAAAGPSSLRAVAPPALHAAPAAALFVRHSSSLATDAPAPYTITDAPSAPGPAGKPKWGKCVLKNVRGHTKKLNPIARQVVGLSVPEALAQMIFAQPIRAASLKTAIQRAAWNADFYHNIPPAALMVDRAWTGKEVAAPRIRHHSKGRAGMAHFRTSRLTVRLRAMTPAEAEKLVKFPRLPSAEARAGLHPRGY